MEETIKSTRLIWITPDAENQITYCARVSNPANQDKLGYKLIAYLIHHRHWSPFEMASMCVEINTTRDIARQILRHRSFSFQEFSQRYADPSVLSEHINRPARMQDETNRQNSLECTDENLAEWWQKLQNKTFDTTLAAYKEALKLGIAKEVARVLLPEGMTPSRLYMSGTIRSFLHYCSVRHHEDTQLEHQIIAAEITDILLRELPTVSHAYFSEIYDA